MALVGGVAPVSPVKLMTFERCFGGVGLDLCGGGVFTFCSCGLDDCDGWDEVFFRLGAGAS